MVSRKVLAKRIKIRGGHLSHDAEVAQRMDSKWVVNLYRSMYCAYKDNVGDKTETGMEITQVLVDTIRNRMLNLMKGSHYG